MERPRVDEEEVFRQLAPSLRAFINYERFNLHKPDMFQLPGLDARFDSKYFPQNSPPFQMPCFWVGRQHVHRYGEMPSLEDAPPFLRSEGAFDQVLLPVHPIALEHYRPFLASVSAADARIDGPRIWAVPTSSTRTLLAWPDEDSEKAVFVKTHIPYQMSGDRRMYGNKVARGVGLCQLVVRELESLPENITFFPETLGILPRALPDSGFVLRLIPDDIKRGRLEVAPLFALWGGDEMHEPLFLSFVRGGANDPQFLIDTLLSNVARTWLKITFDHGLIIESHGQDLLFPIERNKPVFQRLLYRDFEGVQVDWQLRRSLGLTTTHELPRAHSWQDTYAGWGYRYSTLIFYKLMISLYQFGHLVLQEWEPLLRDWETRGKMGHSKIDPAPLTAQYSAHLRKQVLALFGFTPATHGDVFASIKAFVKDLMYLRSSILRDRAAT